jgi:Putative zinc-finger
MTCEEFEAQLTAFSLGELEPDDAMGARAHVARCDACAAATLRDRQLTALLRASMVEMPAEGQTAVLAAVRSETTWAPRPAPRPAAAAGAGTRVRRHRSRRGRRHWLALAAAAVLALAVLALAVVLVPAPDRSSAIAAGWNLYRQEATLSEKQPSAETARRLTSALGAAARPPDLRGFGLQAVGWDGRMLADHLASVAEYRDVTGKRVTLMRWRGELPHPTRGSPEFASYEGMQTAQWGGTGSVWFKTGDIVYCLVGTVAEHTLTEVAHYLGAA